MGACPDIQTHKHIVILYVDRAMYYYTASERLTTSSYYSVRLNIVWTASLEGEKQLLCSTKVDSIVDALSFRVV